MSSIAAATKFIQGDFRQAERLNIKGQEQLNLHFFFLLFERLIRYFVCCLEAKIIIKL